MAGADRVSRVAKHFEDAILSGQLQPGDPLPPERDISAQLGVSRSVVREAIGRLASLGLVKSVHGSGTRVESPSGQPIRLGYQRLLSSGEARLEDLAAVRLPLETTIAELAARHRRPDDLRRLRETQRVLRDAAAGLEDHIKADLDFHATLAAATGNPLFGLVLAPIQELLIASRRLTLERYGAALAHRHHAAILAAVAASDAAAAAAAMRAHLQTNVTHLQAESPEAGKLV